MSKEELLELLENINYATFFEQLDELGAYRHYMYSDLKHSFILGERGKDFNGRCRVFVGEFFRWRETRIYENSTLAWEFNKDLGWLPIASKNIVQRENFDKTVIDTTRKMDKNEEIHFLGMPKVGRSTHLTQLLKSISDMKSSVVLYIPNQNFELNDYLQILQTDRYRELVGGQHIVGLDNFQADKKYQDIFRNATLCIIPQKLSNPYTSEYIKPFSETETKKIISNQIREVEINSAVIDYLIKCSGGIPKLIDLLLAYFAVNHHISIKKMLDDRVIINELDRISDNLTHQFDKTTFQCFIALVGVGKPVSSFFKHIKNTIQNDMFALLQNLGVDNILKSPLLLTFFNRKYVQEILFFEKEGVKDFISLENKDKTAVWTANNELKFVENNTSYENLASNIFRSEVLLHRIDWEKSLVNNQNISSKHEVAIFGDKLNYIIGKRDDSKLRDKEYKKKNKKYKKIVAYGDSASKKCNYVEAEKYYKEAISMKLDTKYAEVRLANLYRVQEKLNEAIEICEPIIRSTPNPFAHLCLGICRFWQGEHYEALYHFENSFNIYPKHTNTILWLARVLIHLGQFEKAEKVLGNIKSSKLSFDTYFLYLLLNYTIYGSKEYNQKLQMDKWRRLILSMSSDRFKKISKQNIYILGYFLSRQINKEPEFLMMENQILSNTDIKQELDIFWWCKII